MNNERLIVSSAYQQDKSTNTQKYPGQYGFVSNDSYQ